MVIKERSWNSSNYRFGFNGQEKDDEVSGAENSYTAQFWQYDSRLGRRWNVDPKPNNTFSSYACLANNPVLFIDHEGDTIRNSFSGRGARFLNNMYRMWTTHTKVGREFKEDFSVGGKYEHITVQWTNNPWKGNETSRIIRLPDGTSQNLNYINDKSFPNLSSIASGTNTDGSSILVQININQNLVKESYFSGLLQIALALDAILHEVQHNEIALISMIRKGSIPTPYAQHMTMLNKNKKYYWQRQNQFKVFRTGWLEDYKKQKESYGFKSEQDFIDANVHEFDHQENTKGQGD